tara:strand:- start:4297 stop:5472 length:1176 start_codon:yes stop_codon:yes gene_type:complete
VSNNLKVLLNSLDEKELRKLIGKEKLQKMQGKPKVKVVEKEPDLADMKADMQDFINKSIKAGFKELLSGGDEDELEGDEIEEPEELAEEEELDDEEVEKKLEEYEDDEEGDEEEEDDDWDQEEEDDEEEDEEEEPVEERKFLARGDFIGKAVNFSGKADVRYYLNGVYLEPHKEQGTYIVATDGHRLGVFLDKSFTISRSCILCNKNKDFYRALNTIPKDADYPCLKFKFIKSEDKKTDSYVFGKVKVKIYYCRKNMEEIGEDADAEFTIDLVDGKYPDWRKVMPDVNQGFDEEEVTIVGNHVAYNLNVNYLMDIKKVFNKGMGSISQGISILHQNDEKAVMVKVTEVPEFIGLIMPMKLSVNDQQEKQWIKLVEETKKNGPDEKKKKKAS